VAELIGTATTERDGLLRADVFKSRLQYIQLSLNKTVKLSNKLGSYDSLILIGVNLTKAAPFHVVIVSINNSVYYGGNKPSGLYLKIDGNKDIYAHVPSGADIRVLVIGCNTTISTVNDFPSDAVYIPQKEYPLYGATLSEFQCMCHRVAH
jgi:hypothetical protein